MKYKIEEKWLTKYSVENHQDNIKSFINDYAAFVHDMAKSMQRKECISGVNRIKRSHFWSCENIGLKIKVGDVCFVDFGHGYINECAYQHFALVVKLYRGKAFVVPMTSNPRTVALAKSKKRSHLFYMGHLQGLDKETCVFINDARFINTARVISVNAQLDKNDEKFKIIAKKYADIFMLK